VYDEISTLLKRLVESERVDYLSSFLLMFASFELFDFGSKVKDHALRVGAYHVILCWLMPGLCLATAFWLIFRPREIRL
jgi:hypothetical protein